MQQAPNTPSKPDRILRLPAVLDRTGLSRSTLYRKIQTGSFPKQIALSARCAGWRESAVEAWMRNPMFYSVEAGAEGSPTGRRLSPAVADPEVDPIVSI